MNQLLRKALINLFSQITDVDIYHIGTSLVIEAPYMLFNLASGEDMPLIPHQVFQNGVFSAGKLYDFSSPAYLMAL